MVLHAEGPDSQALSFTIAEFDDQKVKICGKELTFEIRLMELA